MANMMKLMKKAASLQQDMKKAQDGLADKEVEFSSGGGMVTVVAKGDMSIGSIKIDPKCVDPEDVEMLEDLVLAGVDGAIKAAREMVSEEMGKLTSGLGLPPGFELPF